ncbi:hypothetical protein [Nostoc sphaeroides]|uniref:Uncharacterized protein n=1 Tax=Nostoc sphaeroides CCNUC1 TaxID=2653204 RepID=A0A5P8VVP0_9NOSO|nr:hypothetical protein [Nostoc sphaeroides]MCC5628991.1 hypothetical protein [Nostoc sphaeroides CHAB 2801]QFS44411.1 hypothetical protein GXM_01886 [Nostoc sphaeroides CCNUC1]
MILLPLIYKAKGIALGGVTASDGHVLSLASQIRNVSQLSEEFDRS